MTIFIVNNRVYFSGVNLLIKSQCKESNNECKKFVKSLYANFIDFLLIYNHQFSYLMIYLFHVLLREMTEQWDWIINIQYLPIEKFFPHSSLLLLLFLLSWLIATKILLFFHEISKNFKQKNSEIKFFILDFKFFVKYFFFSKLFVIY